MFYLTLAFLITAFLYASVGFGGGSTYNALLILYNVDYLLIPKIALTAPIILGIPQAANAIIPKITPAGPNNPGKNAIKPASRAGHQSLKNLIKEPTFL